MLRKLQERSTVGVTAAEAKTSKTLHRLGSASVRQRDDGIPQADTLLVQPG
jgi:hypothetical protein